MKLKRPLQTPLSESLAQQWGHYPQLSSHLCTSPDELLGVGGVATWLQIDTSGVCRVCRVSGRLSDSPQPPDQLGILQQAGVDGQPQLALRHGQLAVFKRVVCDGYPQRSKECAEVTADQLGPTGALLIPTYQMEYLFIRNVNLLSHDTPHIDGKQNGVPFLLLRGCVDRKELRRAKTGSIMTQRTKRTLDNESGTCSVAQPGVTHLPQ